MMRGLGIVVSDADEGVTSALRSNATVLVER